MIREDKPRLEANEGALSKDAYRLLAHANLLRIRGYWEEAIEECMEAMRIAPGNAAAQSLLGDIYENRGNIDDAIQWYRMALDVNPESPADQLKLARLIEAKAKLLQAPERSVISAPPPVARVIDPHLPAAPRITADRVIRIVAFASALFLVVVITLGLFMARSRSAGAGHHAIAAGKGRTFDVTPLFVNSDPDPPAPESPASVPKSSLTWRDGTEAAALNAMRLNLDLANNGLHVVDALIDPRDNHLTVTVSSEALPSIGRDYYLRHALRTLRVAESVADADINVFTIRFLSAPQDGATPASPSLVLAADASRLPAVAPDTQEIGAMTTPQLQGAFGNIWWSPAVP